MKLDTPSKRMEAMTKLSSVELTLRSLSGKQRWSLTRAGLMSKGDCMLQRELRIQTGNRDMRARREETGFKLGSKVGVENYLAN